MVTSKQRNFREVHQFRQLLTMYKNSYPDPLESAVEQLHETTPNGQFDNEEAPDRYYDLEDLDTLLSDLLADLFHFLCHSHTSLVNAPHVDLLMGVELDNLIDALRNLANEHELCWETALLRSFMQFADEVEGEIEES